MSTNGSAPPGDVMLEVLGQRDCLRLLGSVPVGRVIYTRHALPAVELVNFIVLDGSIVFRTSASGKLAAAIREAVVAFEADYLDSLHRSGWSVCAVGRARMVTDVDEQARLRESGLNTWMPGPHEYFVRITPGILTGRRLGHPAENGTFVPCTGDSRPGS